MAAVVAQHDLGPTSASQAMAEARGNTHEPLTFTAVSVAEEMVSYMIDNPIRYRQRWPMGDAPALLCDLRTEPASEEHDGGRAPRRSRVRR